MNEGVSSIKIYKQVSFIRCNRSKVTVQSILCSSNSGLRLEQNSHLYRKVCLSKVKRHFKHLCIAQMNLKSYFCLVAVFVALCVVRSGKCLPYVCNQMSRPESEANNGSRILGRLNSDLT